MATTSITRSYLMQHYLKGNVYSFVVTKDLNAVGCQIVQDSQGIRHLLTGTQKNYAIGKSVRLVVRGYSHKPSQITGHHYLVLSPEKGEASSALGKHVIPPKRKKTNFNRDFLLKTYSIGKRYLFIVTNEWASPGCQFVEDSFGIRHLLNNANTYYLAGDKVRCTVNSIPKQKNVKTGDYYLTLAKPRIANTVRAHDYIKSPQKWRPEVQGFDRHLSGRPFTCACCGLDFPKRMGYRVEIKDVYFCRSCAAKIFGHNDRRVGPSLIYTPMGNKR